MDGGVPDSAVGGSSWWTAAALWTLVLFGSLLLNATLLLAFVRRPGLRTISNRFVMNLTASNLLTCAILTPLLMMDASPISSSASLCSISEGATALVTASSVLSVLLIAIDQYFAVVDPLRYRTHIDKLKCAVLIIAIWMASILFGLLATFNPDPHSLWLSCNGAEARNFSANSTLDLTIDSTILFGNGTEDYNMEAELKLTEQNGSSTLEEEVEFAENSTSFLGRTILGSFDDANVTFSRRQFHVTYGLVYTTAYSLFVYLFPFVGVCWIYISIYLAAHKNSERARRTGSGPMLSSPSFCEEYCGVRQEFSTEDFRKLPKISSLSSIDESIETMPSQLPQRISEMMLSSAIEEEPSGVVFTVGSQKVDVTPQKVTVGDAKDTSKVPISALRTEFLEKKEVGRIMDEIVRSKFLDRPDDRRKSSHDIMYEAMLQRDLGNLRLDVDSSDESNSENEEEMLTFTRNRRLQDIEVSKCQNSMEDDSNYTPLIENHDVPPSGPPKDPDTHVVSETETELAPGEVQTNTEDDSDHLTTSNSLNKVQNSHTIVTNGTLSKAAVENHNTKSKLQNGYVSSGKSNGRYTNGNNRLESTFETADDVYPKNPAGITFSDAESSNSLLGTSVNAPMVTITPPNKNGLHRVSSIRSTSSYINSLKYRISNASLFKYREETRAARVSALVIVMGLICWTPYIVILNLRNFPYYDGEVLPHKYDVMALSFLILAAYVSPLLFGYRSRRVKRELRKIFCFKKELSYKNNRSLMAKKVIKRRHSSNLSQLEMDPKYHIFSCVYGRNRWPKEKVQFMQVPETALAVETCRSSFSSGASTQISTTSTEEC